MRKNKERLRMGLNYLELKIPWLWSASLCWSISLTILRVSEFTISPGTGFSCSSGFRKLILKWGSGERRVAQKTNPGHKNAKQKSTEFEIPANSLSPWLFMKETITLGHCNSHTEKGSPDLRSGKNYLKSHGLLGVQPVLLCPLDTPVLVKLSKPQNLLDRSSLVFHIV